MSESEGLRVKHEARRFEEWPQVVANVDTLARKRMARFRQLNANLVRAPGLESARHEAESTEALEHLHVGDGVLARALRRVTATHLMLDAAAKAVTAIFDERAFERRLVR